MKKLKREQRIMRHKRVRAKIKGTKDVPRISVFRSNKHIFAQLIDDAAGRTMASNTLKSRLATNKGTKTESATKIGEKLAEKAKEAGIKKVVFDRGGYKYHGRVKALAEGLRKGGLEF
ncbi:MAG: 50S ribosomal protein L18 [Candidatus Yanofskybacteria bacterium]|nr:50S ribosomal protein L18 [Candidatus Yanofskybacteria bacterium]